jgi:hypothetical protein
MIASSVGDNQLRRIPWRVPPPVLGQRRPGAQYIRADIVGKKWEACHVLKFCGTG